MRILRAIMIGDVVGDPGLEVLENRLPHLVKEYSADFTIVNGENASGGFGLTQAHLEKLFAAGADAVTGGNHVWEQRDFWPVLDSEKRVLRPMNYPAGSPGRGWVRIEKPAVREGPAVAWAVVNLQGREFMSPLDCPFRAFDAFESCLKEGTVPAGEDSKGKPLILVDFHAESSREKEALAYYLDGRASVVVGTHTHVQTADERVLPKGTAYITDLGMTGALDGVIGMDPKICLDRARNQVLYRMEVAAPGTEGKTAVQGVLAEIDSETGKAVSIKRISA
jgi:metallophosphoesterase (TIGR00282 family)